MGQEHERDRADMCAGVRRDVSVVGLLAIVAGYATAARRAIARDLAI